MGTALPPAIEDMKRVIREVATPFFNGEPVVAGEHEVNAAGIVHAQFEVGPRLIGASKAIITLRQVQGVSETQAGSHVFISVGDSDAATGWAAKSTPDAVRNTLRELMAGLDKRGLIN